MDIGKLIKLVRILVYATAALGIAALLIFLALGDSRDPSYFYGTLAALPLFGLSIFLHYRLGRLKDLRFIRQQWGKVLERKRNFDNISLYHRFCPHLPGKAPVDDTTWQDLNMNELYTRIDRTLTGPGEGVLYQILRTPCTGESLPELRRRDEIISVLQQDAKTREALQMALLRLGRDKDHTLTRLLWEPLPDKPTLTFIYSLLALVALLSLTAPIFLGTPGLSLVMLAFSLNSLVHYQVRKRYSYHIPSITSLSGLLRAARSLTQANLPGLEPEQKQLRKGLAAARKLNRKLRALFLDSLKGSDAFFLIQYVQILFLVEVRSFYGALAEIRGNLQALRELFTQVGALDAMQAVASYRVGLDHVKPEFCQEACLKAVEIRHPLLENPVPNSIEIRNQGILITGSNMAGKSTFLRTLVVNAILAQSLFICTAAAYTACFLQVCTSINKADDISQQKSLYYAEAERLLKIIRPQPLSIPRLLLIDELLSGTNYTERLAASAAILDYLKGQDALVVVATHDLDLAESLGSAYLCYHFSDKVDKNNLGFDYTLKKGIATTRNAIKLLEYMGYPQEVIHGANSRFSPAAKGGK